MLELFNHLLSPGRYIPHGHCYLWQTPLVLLHLISDALIAIAYFSIPAILLDFIHKRKDIAFSNVFALFGAFIILCGTGHLLDIWTLWHPIYWVSGIERALTAVVSCYTAVQLVSLLPKFLTLKTPEQLEAINQALQQEIVERQRAEDTLRNIVTGTASVTGTAFFPALVEHLAIALKVPYVMVSEDVNDSPEQLKTLAVWFEQGLMENITFESAGTPCGTVIQGAELRCYPDALRERFPENPLLIKMCAESYLGIPLMSTSGQVIGNLCLFSKSKMTEDDTMIAILRVFAARAAAELERQRSEQARNQAYQELEFRVEERTTALVKVNTTLGTEIQERIAAEAELQHMAEGERALTRVILRMRQSLDLADIFGTTTKELRQAIRCDRALIYRFNPDWSGKIVAESVADGWNVVVPFRMNDVGLTKVVVDEANCLVKRLDSGTEVLIRDTYLQTHEGGFYRQRASYCCVQDVYAAGFDACYLNFLESLQARAYVIFPIFCGSQLWGLLAAYQNSGPRQWQEAETRIMSQISDQLGVAVQQAELFAQTQQQAVVLKQAKETADTANRAKSEFLSNMSHELRTPLNAVLGFTQLLSADSSLTPTQHEHIGIVNRSGEHLLKLINDVLEMSKIEAGRIALENDRFDLYSLLASLKAIFQLRCAAKGLQLVVDYAEAVPRYVIADEGKLRQVLLNLLSNAIKFTNQGSITLQVAVVEQPASVAIRQITAYTPVTHTSSLTLNFAVEDTGEGIAREEWTKLFKPFEQTSTGLKSFEGTGLGLAISQKFVQLMGGEITVTSALDVGSRFCFEIPVQCAHSMAPPLFQPSAQTIIGLAPNQPTCRILIAEDNLTNRYLLSEMLCLQGFELQEAENGQAAIACWREWQPHLILMDMRMPIMDGLEATRRIKAEPQGNKTVIIALTASAFSEQRRTFIAAGCDDFISKPFQRHALLSKIGQYLGVRYLYDQTGDSHLLPSLNDKQTRSLAQPDLKANMGELPEVWKTQLHRAALAGSDSQILALLNQLPLHQTALKNAIVELTDNFQFECIIELLALSDDAPSHKTGGS